VSLVAFVWNEKSFASVLSFRFCRLELGTGKKKKNSAKDGARTLDLDG
jgi:hypothetical protein